jgi:hypothetical protein
MIGIVVGTEPKHANSLYQLEFLMPVPVMSRANTDTESKYQKANPGTGTIIECQVR